MPTTEPIFEGYTYNPVRLHYISKFVYLPIDEKTYTIQLKLDEFCTFGYITK
jgi:hypothetical protein